MTCCVLHIFTLLKNDNAVDELYDTPEEPKEICIKREQNAASVNLKRDYSNVSIFNCV